MAQEGGEKKNNKDHEGEESEEQDREEEGRKEEKIAYKIPSCRLCKTTSKNGGGAPLDAAKQLSG
jgi:hypothetical protein